MTATPGAPLYHTAQVAGRWGDPDLSNNATTTWVDVIGTTSFSSVRGVAAGGSHTLALKTTPDGTVWAWGANTQGQLGNGSYVGGSTPVQVNGLSEISAVAAGGAHSLALKTDGTVWAWGTNEYGQLGTGSDLQLRRNVPGQVQGLTNVIAIAAGNSDSFAIKADGTLWAWGWNIYGQLGLGQQVERTYSALQVPGLSNVSRVTAGYYHTLAVKSDGTLLTWGYNNHGQCGVPLSEQPLYAPTVISSLTNVAEVAAGNLTSYALRRDGTVWSWGWGGDGSRGDGSGGPDRAVPGRVGDLNN